MNKDCIFCKIATKEIPSQFIYEDENLFVIEDINPKSNIHWLIIPKAHVRDLAEFKPSKELALDIFTTVSMLNEKLEKPNFKLQVNNGAGAGQEVFHLHFHFLSSSKLKSTG